MRLALKLSTAAMFLFYGCTCGPTEVKLPPAEGELVGRVELAADVPATGCAVLVDGAPLGARCGPTGDFHLRHVPVGRRDLLVLADAESKDLPSRRVVTAVNTGLITDVGAIRLGRPGSIGGRISGATADQLARAVVTLQEGGLAVAPNTNGGFLMPSVPPGVHAVVLLLGEASLVSAPVLVEAGKLSLLADFVAAEAKAAELGVVGRAVRGAADERGSRGLTVELVETRDGRVVESLEAQESGVFRLAAKPGIYLVRARDGANPRVAMAPVVVAGEHDVSLGSALVVLAEGGDLDGDGTSDAEDPDLDGDGVANEKDAFPYDFLEQTDSDGDGIGDRADLRSKGGTGIDSKPPTPDADGDGHFDFADDCPQVADELQKDTDGDGPGDVCDNCPTAPNPGQEDTVGNGTGDACRACQRNSDCGGAKLCQAGACVDCFANSQCGQKVCKAGACVACGATGDCTPGTLCHLASGRCQQCLTAADCAGSERCVLGACVPACTLDVHCPGGYCVNGSCALCRNHADCGSTQWCDNGGCRPQCTTSGDCTDGRTCDLVTKTCIYPCGGCLPGQVCGTGNLCRQACDGSTPCPSGQVCSAQNQCQPECAVTADCAAKPFTTCQAGACVPSGACAFDGDCPASKLCVAGTCQPRPTSAADAGYTCTQACDCRMGEVCTGGVCVADLVPSLFVQADGGSSTPSTPQQATASLAAALALAGSGDVVALRAGDKLAISPLTLDGSKSGVTIAGGYKVCASNRWVKDPPSQTQLTTAISSGNHLIEVVGSTAAPTGDVALENLDLLPSTGCNYAMVRGVYADRLRLSNVSGTFVGNPGNCGLINAQVAYCDGCRDVSWTDVEMRPSPNLGNVAVAQLENGSGTLRRAKAPLTVQTGVYGVAVVNAVGPVTVDGARTEGGTVTSGGSDGVLVSGAPLAPVTVANGQFLFPSGGTSSQNHWAGVHVVGAPDVTVSNNVVDGRGVIGPLVMSPTVGLLIEDSNGAVSGNTVYLPVGNATSTYLYGINVKGPRGEVNVSGNLVSGGGGDSPLRLVFLENVTAGVPTVSGNDLSASTARQEAAGLWVTNGGVSSASGFVFTNNVVRVPGSASCGSRYGFYLNNTFGRIERSRFFVGQGGNVAGGWLNGSQLELYDSYLVPSQVYGTCSGNSYGLGAAAFSTLWATGNTLEGGGTLNSNSPSHGVYTDPGSGGTLVSNLISGGSSVQHVMYAGGGMTSRKNYFWFQRADTMSGGDNIGLVASVPDAGVPDPNGNIRGYADGCYDPGSPAPVIAAGSGCVNRGEAGTRRDGSPLTLDLDGGPRVLGTAADIGCLERE